MKPLQKHDIRLETGQPYCKVVLKSKANDSFLTTETKAMNSKWQYRKQEKHTIDNGKD